MSNSVSPWLTNLTTSNFLKPTYVNGFLDVSGGDILSRAGNFHLLDGDATLNKRLLVGEDASFGGDVYIAKDIIIHGNLSVDKYKNNAVITTIATNVFSLNEDISLNGNISVSGNVNFPNDSIPNSAIIGGAFGGAFFTNTEAKFIAAGSKVTMNLDNITADTLGVVGTLSVSKAFGVGVTNPQYPIDVGTGGVGCGRYVQFGDVPLSATTAPTPVRTNIILGTFNELLTTIAADTSLNGRLFVSADSSMNGRLYVGGDASLGGRFFVGSNLSVGGDGTFNGNVTMSGNASALSFQTTSDYRIKENVRGLSGNITVDSLKPIQYFNTRARRLDIGFLAHEVQEDFPFLVEGEKDGENLQTLNYIGLVGVLVKEIQELKARVAVLESQVPPTTL